jgi:hypothetical protein
MLTNKKNLFYENCTALRCYHLGGEKLAKLGADITLLVIFFLRSCIIPEITAGDYSVLDW